MRGRYIVLAELGRGDAPQTALTEGPRSQCGQGFDPLSHRYEPIATARIVHRLFCNEDVGGMFCTCALAHQRQAHELSRIHPSLAASRRAALRKATRDTARKITPQPSALGYARIPMK